MNCKRWLAALGNLLWPPVCATCPAQLPLVDDPADLAGHLCPRCLAGVELLPAALCPHCGRPFWQDGDHLCGDCLKKPPVFTRARTAAVYAGAVARSISLLKYHNGLAQVKFLSALAGPILKPLAESCDIIVPVPISPGRRRERGYNQALELALALYGDRRGLIREGALTRPADHGSRQAVLSAAERRRAIRGCFTVAAPDLVAGRRCLLVDDVLTTGATAGEAASALLKAGAAEVAVAAIARAVPDSWRITAAVPS